MKVVCHPTPLQPQRDRAPHPGITAPPSCCRPTPSSPNMPAPASRAISTVCVWRCAAPSGCATRPAPLLRRKYGIELLEGYGVTEASPVVAANQPDANRPGTVGRLMPGMEARLDPVEGIPNAGRLFVQGPERHARLYQADAPGVIVPPRGRLARHGRRRRHRR